LASASSYLRRSVSNSSCSSRYIGRSARCADYWPPQRTTPTFIPKFPMSVNHKLEKVQHYFVSHCSSYHLLFFPQSFGLRSESAIIRKGLRGSCCLCHGGGMRDLAARHLQRGSSAACEPEVFVNAPRLVQLNSKDLKKSSSAKVAAIPAILRQLGNTGDAVRGLAIVRGGGVFLSNHHNWRPTVPSPRVAAAGP
jgi:hypothetical protein